jgi:hypothetical protein
MIRTAAVTAVRFRGKDIESVTRHPENSRCSTPPSRGVPGDRHGADARANRTTRSKTWLRASSAPAQAQFLKDFTCRLVLFGYRDGRKDPRHGREFASIVILPPWVPPGQPGPPARFALSARLRSQDDGALELSRGVGVVLVVEKTSPGRLEPAAGQQAFVCLDAVELRFLPRPRNDDVQV